MGVADWCLTTASNLHVKATAEWGKVGRGTQSERFAKSNDGEDEWRSKAFLSPS